jgi:hypothetical protein
MPVSSFTRDLDTIGVATLDAVGTVIADTIFEANAFSKEFKRRKGIRFQNGGMAIQAPLRYGKNNTVGAYRGADTLPVQPTEELTAARYGWRQAAGAMMLVGLEELQNSGKHAVIDMMAEKAMTLELSFQEWFNDQLLLPTASKDIIRDMIGIQQIIENTAEASQGTLGGISKSANTWWRNRRTAVTAASVAYDTEPIHKAALKMINDCSRQIHRPDLILTTQTRFEDLEKEQLSKGRYQLGRMTDLALGMEKIHIRGVEVIWDATLTTDAMFFISTKHLDLFVHPKRNFKATPIRQPINQDVYVSHMLFAGNLTSNNNRHHGVLDLSGVVYA